MKQINSCELNSIKGGISLSVAIAVVSAVLFVSQIIEGFIYPRSCNNE